MVKSARFVCVQLSAWLFVMDSRPTFTELDFSLNHKWVCLFLFNDMLFLVCEEFYIFASILCIHHIPPF